MLSPFKSKNVARTKKGRPQTMGDGLFQLRKKRTYQLTTLSASKSIFMTSL